MTATFRFFVGDVMVREKERPLTQATVDLARLWVNTAASRMATVETTVLCVVEGQYVVSPSVTFIHPDDLPPL